MNRVAPTASLLALLIAPAIAQGADPGFIAVDYQKIERKLVKQPSYVAAPRYALFVLDLAGKYRVWAVADKTSADADYYDVLYLDLNADGDLTQADERFVGKFDAKLVDAGMGTTIRVGTITVPGQQLEHTKFLLSTSPKKGRTGFWFRMLWAGKQEMSGGYAPVGEDTTEWGETPAKAPILRPCPFGPLTFAAWGERKLELRAGNDTHLNILVGCAGSGPDALAVVDEKFLDLERDELNVTVIGKDADGREVKATTRIKKHC
ncbi:MAG TPA: hypothetical protein VK348_13545 [Planctomycetota bacterium]|nr:hypothetical protein [Planctomycetota bacterium]